MISDNRLALDLESLAELDDFGLLVELDQDRAKEVARLLRHVVDYEVDRAVQQAEDAARQKPTQAGSAAA
jgi:hypothetical protein